MMQMFYDANKKIGVFVGWHKLGRSKKEEDNKTTNILTTFKDHLTPNNKSMSDHN